ncbi:hypothetical protein BDR03DRAFT_952070 [Suillus americanus]|nr:hypothetical protein BDR03DRAFT_952070 [Suillus americanus]
MTSHRRKSDTENELLHPELLDAEEVKAFLTQAQSGSLPQPQQTSSSTLCLRVEPASEWSLTYRLDRWRPCPVHSTCHSKTGMVGRHRLGRR